MASFNHFKRKIVLLSSILLIAFGIVFALASDCTGRYNSFVTKIFVNLLNFFLYIICIAQPLTLQCYTDLVQQLS